MQYRDLPADTYLCVSVFELCEGHPMLLVGSSSMPMFSKKGALKTGQQRLQVGIGQLCASVCLLLFVCSIRSTAVPAVACCSCSLGLGRSSMPVLPASELVAEQHTCPLLMQVWEGADVDVAQPQLLLGKPALSQRSQVSDQMLDALSIDSCQINAM